MEKLQYKIKNGPRVEALNQFKLEDGTIVAIFQGFRGENPELDFIVKYKEPGKRLRTPSHTHWIVDLIVKGEINKSWLSYNIAKALDYPFKKKTNSIGVGGCGMDMGFSVISNLADELFGDYKKLKYEQL